ncbi:MAG: hypothetical protein JJE02_10675 [Propionibacteriales bacterium]|nr:hypothetical protein [Propionibacteriales bacterium]
MSSSIYIGKLVAEPSIEAKINQKHNVTLDEVREAIQWPAVAEAAKEEHPVHGIRWVCVGTVADGRQLIAWIMPRPPHFEESADTWTLKTASWL